jgi:hypothetical protein
MGGSYSSKTKLPDQTVVDLIDDSEKLKKEDEIRIVSDSNKEKEKTILNSIVEIVKQEPMSWQKVHSAVRWNTEKWRDLLLHSDAIDCVDTKNGKAITGAK